MTMVRNLIRKYRTDRNLSQAELSDLMPGSPGKTVLSLIENGHVLPTCDVLESLCDVLKCTPTDLYDANDLNLMKAVDEGGGFDASETVVTIIVTKEVEEALKELGYSDVNEWLDEERRNLLKTRDIRLMSKRIILQ